MSKSDRDPFDLSAGVPEVPGLQGELTPKPKTSRGMSRKVMWVLGGLLCLLLVVFFVAMDKVDEKTKNKVNGKPHEEETKKGKGQPENSVPKEFLSSKKGPVTPPTATTQEGSEGASSAAAKSASPSAAGKGVSGKPGSDAVTNATATTTPGGTGQAAGKSSIAAATSGASVVPALGGTGASGQSGPGAQTPEEKRAITLKAEREERLMKGRGGLEAKSYGGIEGAGSAPGKTAKAVQERKDRAADLTKTLLAGGKGAGADTGLFGGNSGEMGSNAANADQDQKLRFLKSGGGADSGYLGRALSPPMSRFQLNAGAYIPMILEMGVNSDLPGLVKARVRENVYATVNHMCLLIPSGTAVIGNYDSRVALGQNRQLIVWNRMTFPNGNELDIAGMPTADEGGMAGLEADVDNHYLRLFGAALGMSLVTANVQMSVSVPPTPANGTIPAPTAAQAVSTALSQQFGQLGAQIMGKYVNVQPTLRNYAGERFNIVVSKNIVLPGCYPAR